MPSAGDALGSDFVVRLRGLPWSCAENDIREFFKGISQDIPRIILCLNHEGRLSGEAYVEFANYNDYQIALAKDKEKIGKRYIEIFPSKKKEMEYMTGHNREAQNSLMTTNNDCIIRLRGLPFGCWEDDIQNFFSGLDIAPNGILLITDANGRQSGEAFVQFANQSSYEAALMKHKENIGHRYVEIFRSSYEELERYLFPEFYDFDYPRFQPMSYGGGRSMGRSGAGGMSGGGGGGRFGSGTVGGRFESSMGMRGGSRGDPFGAMGGGGGMMSGRFSPYGGGAGGLGGFRRGMGLGMGGGGGGGGAGGLGGPGLGAYGGRSPLGGGGLGAYGGMGGGGGGGQMAGLEGAGGGVGSLMDTSGSGGGGFGIGGGRVVGNKAADKPLKHYVYMRGLPFSCTNENIVQFFSPLRLAGVQFNFDAMGRPSGEARIEFFTHDDAVDAMKRDRQKIDDRYIELFLSSETKDDDSFIPPSVLSANQKAPGAASSMSQQPIGMGVGGGATTASMWGGSGAASASSAYSGYSDFASNNF